MSHFAELDENNKVIRVLVGDNNLPNEGKDWFEQNLGGTWVQTSYNQTFRKNYAGIGFSYDPELDAFIAPKPFDSWVLNQQTANWEPPTAKPQGDYFWDEETLSWLEVQEA